MVNKIYQWLEAPIFDGDEEKPAQARIANTLIIYLGVTLLVVIFVLIPIFAIQKIGSWILSITMLCGLAIGRRLMKHNKIWLSKTRVKNGIHKIRIL